jgi:hypothetical protein
VSTALIVPSAMSPASFEKVSSELVSSLPKTVAL